jgi:tetratricopeptide (TPR) repeat protein
MGKNKPQAPTPADGLTLERATLTLWLLTFCALAFVPDQKILRYKLVAVEAGIISLLGCVLLSWAMRRDRKFHTTPLDIPVAAYAISSLVFYALSPERAASSLELTRMLFCAATFFAATQTIRGDSLRAIAWMWAGTAGLMGLYAILQMRGGLGPVLIPLLDRPIGTFGNPIFYAGYLAASTIVAMALAAHEKGRLRYWAGSLAVLAFAGALSTQSRAAIAGLGGAAFIGVLLSSHGRRRWIAWGLLGLGVLAAAWAFRSRQWTHGLIWRDTLLLWKATPVLGCGLGRFHIEFTQFASDALKELWPQRNVIINFAHNEYLQVLAETGAVGLGLLLWIPATVASLVYQKRQIITENRLALGFILVVTALGVQNIFSPDLRFGLSSFILFFALGAGAASISSGTHAFPLFPGRLGCAAIGAVALTLWGMRAVEPLLAQKRLERMPKFHAAAATVDPQVAALEAHLQAAPQDIDVAENLAWLYAKKRDWANATRHFEHVHQLAPTMPGPLNNLGNIYYSMGQRERAIQYWKRSLDVKPKQIDAHTNLGKALYEVGRLKEAAAHLQAVLELDPRNEKAQILLKKMIE